MAKQTNITIETDTLLVLHAGQSLKAWCVRCGAQVQMIPLQGLGLVSNLLPAEVEAWIQSEQLHRSFTPEGAPLLCLKSMIGRIRSPETG
ncbi:hypothetical protein [Occallatibacter savannae]|uniref:hypothetical protein n=1 Tax=Occallatibacter savannae TaxID=1002691 RepID=UPI000D69396D|nr:hypothetical protein [Occallatibacter savannae]